jgi:DNA repair protein RadC
MENTNENRMYQVAEIQLTYKSNVKPSLRPKITTSRDAYNILVESWDESKIEFVEQFKVILLNRANKVLGILELSTGSTTGTIADPKLIFASAIKSNSCGIIIAHNHPSGNLCPSQADIDLTKQIKAGGKLLDVSLLDHVIVTTEGYYSFTDNGLV